jgi:hypothetical protein
MPGPGIRVGPDGVRVVNPFAGDLAYLINDTPGAMEAYSGGYPEEV